MRRNGTGWRVSFPEVANLEEVADGWKFANWELWKYTYSIRFKFYFDFFEFLNVYALNIVIFHFAATDSYSLLHRSLTIIVYVMLHT